MPRRRGLLAIIVGLSSIALVFALAGGAAAGKKKKTVKRFAPDMVGAVDVPPGDPDGSGEASFKLKKAKKKVCFNISFQGIDNPTDGHIHEGGSGRGRSDRGSAVHRAPPDCRRRSRAASRPRGA